MAQVASNSTLTTQSQLIKNDQENANMKKPRISSTIRSITEIQPVVVLSEPEEDEGQHGFP